MEVKWTHLGQYHAYGDTYKVAELHTNENLTQEQVKLACVGVIPGKLPKNEWDSKQLSALEYFRGWYSVEKKPFGYLYTECEPYCD